MINILVNGCNGNMGKSLIQYIEENIPDMNVTYMIDRQSEISFEQLDQSLNLCRSSKSIFQKPDVIIDFSAPDATFIALDFATKHLIPIVIATTGFSNQETIRIKEYSQAIPIFKSSNMSYGINLIANILSNISPLLSNMDIEILEKHHNMKKDSPSGTAFLLADAINSTVENKHPYIFDRHLRKKSREKNEIGFSSIRGGHLIGEHSVLFLGDYESIEIKHTAYSRIVYIEGAIRAARFIIQKKNGLYSMQDLLD